MDIGDLMRYRRSIRKYQALQVPRDALEKVLEAGSYAPNAGGGQRTMLVGIRDRALLEQLTPVCGSYVGDGAASKSIALPFTPKAVYACPVHGGTLWIPEGSGNGTTYTYGGLAVTGQNAMTWRGGHDVVAIQTGGFTVYYSYYSNEFMYAAANMSGQTYVYVAIG